MSKKVRGNKPPQPSPIMRAGDHTPTKWRWIRAGAIVAVFLVVGIAVGMGKMPYVGGTSTPATHRQPSPAQEGEPEIAGGIISENRQDGREWQSLYLSGKFNGALDGEVLLSFYQEPAEVLRARMEAEARHSGWLPLENSKGRPGSMELFHSDGRIKVISIEEHPNDLRSVTVFNGTLSGRAVK